MFTRPSAERVPSLTVRFVLCMQGIQQSDADLLGTRELHATVLPHVEGHLTRPLRLSEA